MKPIVILAVGGLSLAATLTVTQWLSARESQPAAVATPPALAEQARIPEFSPPSTNNFSRYHRLGRKWDKANPRSVVKANAESP